MYMYKNEAESMKKSKNSIKYLTFNANIRNNTPFALRKDGNITKIHF